MAYSSCDNFYNYSDFCNSAQCGVAELWNRATHISYTDDNVYITRINVRSHGALDPGVHMSYNNSSYTLNHNRYNDFF